jgi:hypothetical protein
MPISMARGLCAQFPQVPQETAAPLGRQRAGEEVPAQVPAHTAEGHGTSHFMQRQQGMRKECAHQFNSPSNGNQESANIGGVPSVIKWQEYFLQPKCTRGHGLSIIIASVQTMK